MMAIDVNQDGLLGDFADVTDFDGKDADQEGQQLADHLGSFEGRHDDESSARVKGGEGVSSVMLRLRNCSYFTLWYSGELFVTLPTSSR
jgi:hypothetical protein